MAVWEKSEALPTSSDWLNQALKIGLSPFRVNEGSDSLFLVSSHDEDELFLA
jgi:hypothetical protein